MPKIQWNGPCRITHRMCIKYVLFIGYSTTLLEQNFIRVTKAHSCYETQVLQRLLNNSLSASWQTAAKSKST